MRLVFCVLGGLLLLLGVLAELGVLAPPPLRLLPLAVLFFLAPLLGAFLLLPHRANLWIFELILTLAVLQGLQVALTSLRSVLERLGLSQIIEGNSGLHTDFIIAVVLAVVLLFVWRNVRHSLVILLSVVAFFALVGALQTLEIAFLPPPTYQFLPAGMFLVLALFGVFLLLRRTTLFVLLIVFALLGVLQGAEVAIVLLLDLLHHIVSVAEDVFRFLLALSGKTLLYLYFLGTLVLLGGALLFKSQKAFYGLLGFFLILGALQGIASVLNLFPPDLGIRPRHVLTALIFLSGAFVFLFLFPLPIGAVVWSRSPTGEYPGLRRLRTYVADFTFRRVLLLALGVLVVALGTLLICQFLAHLGVGPFAQFNVRPSTVFIVATLIFVLGAFLLLQTAPVERLAQSFVADARVAYEELAIRILRRGILYFLAVLMLALGLFFALQIARILTDFLTPTLPHVGKVDLLFTLPVAFYVAGALVLILAAYLLLWPVRIAPVLWKAPPTPAYGGAFAPNRRLELRYVSLGDYTGPEDIIAVPGPQQGGGETLNDNCTPIDGALYIAVEEGCVLRLETVNDDIRPNFGALEIYAETGGRPLGMALAPKSVGNIAKNDLIVADAYKGLLRIDADRNVRVLCDSAGGRPIGFADAVDVDSKGHIYFTDASARFGARDYGGTFAASQLDILEHSGSGRLLRYDPDTEQTVELLTGLNFPNGLALSGDENSLYLSEGGSYRIQRYSISDGKLEVLFENLPGLPDNIRRGEEGRYWVGLNRPRSSLLDDASEYPLLRKMVARIPIWLRPIPPEYGHVFAFKECANEHGKVVCVVRDLQDPSGTYPSTTGATEIGKRLYVQSLNARGRLGYLATPAAAPSCR